jgi:plasmid stabilization system protein ParE
MTVAWTFRAARDPEEICEYIARDEPVAAQCTTDPIAAAAETLSFLPFRNRRLAGMDLRKLVIPSLPSMVRYSIEEDCALVTAVKRAARRDRNTNL